MSGHPEKVVGTGWIGRYLDHSIAQFHGSSFPTANVHGVLPLTLRGTQVVVPSIQSLENYQFQTDPAYPEDRPNRLATFQRIHAQTFGDPYRDFLVNSGLKALESAEDLQEAAAGYSSSVQYPDDPFGEALKLVAQIMAGGLGTQVLHVAIGGFDTHASQNVAAINQPLLLERLYVVEMRDFYFDPPGLFLRPGDRVLWVLLEDQLGDGHSATAYHPQYDKTSRIPEGAEPWSSPLLTQLGEFYERTLRVVGVHDYFCIPHEDVGMVGRIVVKEAVGPGTQPVSEGISPAGQSSIPTIEELTGPIGLVLNLQARINTSVFHVRQRDRDAALSALNETAVALETGAGREDSLYESLHRVGKLDVVLEGLSKLREGCG